MSEQHTTNVAQGQTRQIINQVRSFWQGEVRDITAFYTGYDQETYQKQVAPGRNTAMYLLAHLIATHDGLQPMLGLGSRSYPELAPFQKEAEGQLELSFSFNELLSMWFKINEQLEEKFDRMTTLDWLSRHNSVSEEDFKAEPMRNKLNVLMNRAAHQRYHRGQLVFLIPKAMAL